MGPLGGCGLRRRRPRTTATIPPDSRRLEDGDCDGVLSAEDCEDDNPLVGAGLEVVGTSFHGCALDCAGTALLGNPIEDDRSSARRDAEGLSVGSPSCGLDLDGNAHCWGSLPADLSPPEGEFIQISTGGGSHTCGLRPDKTIECWGYNFDGRLDAPEGEFESITAGSHHTCALNAAGEAQCWGLDYPYGTTQVPEGVLWASIDAGEVINCGITLSGDVLCWGRDVLDRLVPYEGVNFESISVGGYHSCGLDFAGQMYCWGGDLHHDAEGLEGSYYATSASTSSFSCAIDTTRRLHCWGEAGPPMTTPPPEL